MTVQEGDTRRGWWARREGRREQVAERAWCRDQLEIPQEKMRGIVQELPLTLQDSE